MNLYILKQKTLNNVALKSMETRKSQLAMSSAYWTSFTFLNVFFFQLVFICFSLRIIPHSFTKAGFHTGFFVGGGGGGGRGGNFLCIDDMY